MFNISEILKIILILNVFKYTKSELCPYSQDDECETCQLDANKILSLICTRENSSDYKLLDKINLNTQSLRLNFSTYSQITIKYKNFKILPSFLFEHLEINELILASNEIEYILNDTFSGIKSLVSLDLSNNKLKSIDNLTFSFASNIYLNKNGQFEYLTDISLHENPLEFFNVYFSTALGSLKSFGFSYNQIKRLNYGLFDGLVNLENLSLQVNKISFIENFVFIKLERLTLLCLNGNQLTYISQHLFSGLYKLISLRLDFNLIKFIEPGALKHLINLKKLNLMNNMIKSIDTNTFYGLFQIEAIDLGYNNLEVINKDAFYELNYLEYLNLDSNIINHIDQNAFFYAKNLTKLSLKDNLLDINENFLDNLKNLEELDMENNRVRSLNKVNFFNNLRSLKKLKIKSNFVSSIEQVFKGLDMSERITEIDLSSNLLVKLDNGDFPEKFKNLSRLILDNNKITLIGSETFKYMKNLNSLTINDNFLLDIKNFTFSNLSMLKKLELSYNSISNLYRQTFKGLSSLNFLKLNGNYLSRLDDYLFYELTSIIDVYLEDNEIELISDNLFNCSGSGYSSVKKLDLSLNRIKSLTFIRSCLAKLENINLADNVIERIEKIDFKYAESLKFINLSFNRIVYIEKNVFQYPNFQFLYLMNMSSSPAQKFSFNFIEDFSTSLKELDLSFNRIQFMDLVDNNSILFDDLEMLNMDNCFINDVNKINFNLMTKLYNLTLSNNNLDLSFGQSYFSSLIYMKYLTLKNVNISLINSIDSSIFANLIEIDLSYNKIKKIDSFHFKNCIFLFRLNFSHNQIELIEKGAFDDLSNVYFIDLSYNQIKFIRIDEFYSSQYLVHFIINNNNLSMLNTLTSNYFECLKELRLSYNFIREFKSEAYFYEKTGLNYLFLDHNFIREIKNDSFKFLIYLEQLYLNSNQLGFIESNAFHNFNHLEILRLDDNKIVELDKSIFHSLFKLKYLNLSSNRLGFVRRSFFSKLFNLIELDLSSNNLLTIEAFAMASLQKLKDIYLNANKNLNLDKQSLSGLNSIENIYISFEVLLNNLNKINLINSINLSTSKVVMGRTYYKSLNIIGTLNQNKTSFANECSSILYFLKFNIFINLKTEFEISEFFRKCDKIT